jgi:putative NADH-flavin reductase
VASWTTHLDIITQRCYDSYRYSVSKRKERDGGVNVLVFGASGATGQEVVSQALQQGHRVTALVRRGPAPEASAQRLTIVRGDVRNRDVVATAVDRHDAVICALGASTPLRREPALVEGIRTIVTTMERHRVRRLVYLSFLGVHEGRAQLSILGRWVASPLLLRNVVADHEAKESIIRQSTLVWVIVRPPRLTNGPRRGTYRSGLGIRATSIIPHISRADLADFMLQQLDSDEFVLQAPAVMY